MIAVPLQASAGREHDAHHVPLAADGVAEGVHAALRIDLHLVAVGEDDAAGSHRGRDHARLDDAVADGAGGLISAAADDGHARLAGRSLRAAASDNCR